MGRDRRPTEEKEKEGSEAGVGGPPGKNSTEGQGSDPTQPPRLDEPRARVCDSMANSGNDEVLVWVERTPWLREREEVVRLELEGASHGGGT